MRASGSQRRRWALWAGRLVWVVVLGGSFVLLAGCGDDSNEPTPSAFEQRLAEGWASFDSGAYDDARIAFEAAVELDPTDPRGRTGLGWSFLLLDRLGPAGDAFDTGSAAGASADLNAGWAFVLNAQDDPGSSNEKALATLAADPAWVFEHGLTLTAADLRVLIAANYFVMGEFAQSLASVQVVNPLFDVDPATPEGRAALSVEIERLRALS